MVSLGDRGPGEMPAAPAAAWRRLYNILHHLQHQETSFSSLLRQNSAHTQGEVTKTISLDKQPLIRWLSCEIKLPWVQVYCFGTFTPRKSAEREVLLLLSSCLHMPGLVPHLDVIVQLCLRFSCKNNGRPIYCVWKHLFLNVFKRDF